jgi:hypothetical protein
MPPEDDGTCHRARIIEIIENDWQCVDEWKKALIKFKCLVNDQWEEVVAYNQILDFIEARRVLGPQGQCCAQDEGDCHTQRPSQAWTSGMEGVPIQCQDHLVGWIINLGASHESSQG